MSRFAPINNNQVVLKTLQEKGGTGIDLAKGKDLFQETGNTSAMVSKNYPFKNPNCCVEGDMIYVNMDAVESLDKKMVCLRDIALIIDISGSMRTHYLNGNIENLVTSIIDTLASYDDDGIDLYFFSNGIVSQTSVSNAEQVKQALSDAKRSPNSFKSTMPTECFKDFCNQITQKNRSGTVLFLTDGVMDDGGKELRNFYKNELHFKFRTRDNFYCFCVEFGHSANGALKVLDGLFAPEQGPEDLFDVENAEDLSRIGSILEQVGGMSAIGSDESVTAQVSPNAKIDMVNTDLIENGVSQISGLMNKIMSFRVRAKEPFEITISVQNYDTLKLRITSNGLDAKIEYIN